MILLGLLAFLLCLLLACVCVVWYAEDPMPLFVQVTMENLTRA